jgi:hypothetical protein
VEIEYKLVEDDKKKMVEAAKSRGKATYFVEEGTDDLEAPLPWLKDGKNHQSARDGEWQKYDKPILYI